MKIFKKIILSILMIGSINSVAFGMWSAATDQKAFDRAEAVMAEEKVRQIKHQKNLEIFRSAVEQNRVEIVRGMLKALPATQRFEFVMYKPDLVVVWGISTYNNAIICDHPAMLRVLLWSIPAEHRSAMAKEVQKKVAAASEFHKEASEVIIEYLEHCQEQEQEESGQESKKRSHEDSDGSPVAPKKQEKQETGSICNIM